MKIIDADKLLSVLSKDSQWLILKKEINELSEDRKDDTIEALLKAIDYNESMQDYSISTETIRAIITKNNQQQPSPLRVAIKLANGINSDDAGSNFNIISDEVKAEYLCHRVNKLETDNAALRKELAELKLKLKDLSK